MATQITRCGLPVNDPSPTANRYRTAMVCPTDGLALSGEKLKAALRCLKETGLMRLLEPKKLLAVSRPLSDLQRVNLVFFGCRLLELDKILTLPEQSFVGHQKQPLDGLIERIEIGHPLNGEELTFLAAGNMKCGCRSFFAPWSGCGWKVSEREASLMTSPTNETGF